MILRNLPRNGILFVLQLLLLMLEKVMFIFDTKLNYSMLWDNLLSTFKDSILYILGNTIYSWYSSFRGELFYILFHITKIVFVS